MAVTVIAAVVLDEVFVAVDAIIGDAGLLLLLM